MKDKLIAIISKPSVQWGALLVLVLIVVYFIYKPEIQGWLSRRKGKNDGSNKLAIDPATGVTNPTLAATLSIDTKKQLKRGSRGNEVVVLQQLINETGYKPKLSEDGIFGNLTLTAVRSLMGSPRESVSINDFFVWKTKNLFSGGNATIENGGINSNWLLSIITP